MTLSLNRRKQLTTLHTAFGKRSLYDSVCFCNRCGMCAPVCPAYQEHPQESHSPRGRNQALRYILEGKLKPTSVRKELLALLSSCTLCGQCSAVCPGQIPTVQHMLALRRLLRTSLLAPSLTFFLRLRGTSPRLFSFSVQVGLWLRRLHLWGLLADLPGFTWLKHADEILPTPTPHRFKVTSQKRPSLIYLPSLEAEFFIPHVAQSTYQLASQKHRVLLWNNTASGLFEFTYGNLQLSRRRVRTLLTRHRRTGNGHLPLLTDSIDVYHFLKQAPQLFENFPAWQEKAEHFASCVHFVTDFFPKKPSGIKHICKPVMLMPSALLQAQSSAQQQAAQIMHTLFKKNLVECGYKQPRVAPAGYGFVTGSRANVYNMQAVRTVAHHQVQTVVVLSGLAALELGFSLRQFYPSARACHIAKLNG